MVTERQQRVARLIIENKTLPKPLSGGEIVEKSGYGPGMTSNPSRILESQGVKEALEIAGFNVNAAKTVVSEIMHNPEVDASTRLTAAREVFKVEGSYAPEKQINLNLSVLDVLDDLENINLLNEAGTSIEEDT